MTERPIRTSPAPRFPPAEEEPEDRKRERASIRRRAWRRFGEFVLAAVGLGVSVGERLRRR